VSSRAVRQARHSQNEWARHVERVVSRRDVTTDEPSGIWALVDNFTHIRRCNGTRHVNQTILRHDTLTGLL